MPLFEADTAALSHRTRFDLALASIADEIAGMLARLIAYVGALALLAILGLSALDRLLADAGSPFDSNDKTGSYASGPGRSADDGRHPQSAAGRPIRSARTPDWLTGADAAQLRGAL